MLDTSTMLRLDTSTMLGSSSALALGILNRLQNLEKHLKNEDPAFIWEILQCLEDTIAAIKKLEEIRRHTLECLEEETVINGNLRYRIQKIPGEIAAELTALVTAARESVAAEIQQLKSALKSLAEEIELQEEKQAICEGQHAALCEEQEYLRTKHKQREDLLKKRIAVKNNTNALLLETRHKVRVTERELLRSKAALAELKAKITERMCKLEKEKEEYDEKVKEIKKILATLEAKISKKKHEFEKLKIKLSDLQDLISLNSTAIFNEEVLVAKLKQKVKHLKKTLESKKADMLALSEKKFQLDSELALLQSMIAQEKEDLNKELEKTKEDLNNAKCLNQELKLKNKAMYQKYEQVLEEKKHWGKKKDKAAAKLEGLSLSLDEKLEFLEKLMMKKKNLEKEIENLQNNLIKMKKSNAEKLASLKKNLERENRMRVKLQWKLLYLAVKRELFLSKEEKRNRKVNERTEALKKRHAELLAQIEDLEKKIFQSEKQIKTLSEEASKRKNYYSNYKKDFTNKIMCLENDIKTATENLLKKEEELKTSRLTLQETQREIEQKRIKYEELNTLFLKKKDEELRLRRVIQQSIKTTEKLKENVQGLRCKLQLKRDDSIGKLKNYTENMKLLEQDISKINRRLDILNAENCKLKLCLVQIKENIFSMNSKAGNQKSAAAKMLNDLAVLHDDLLKGHSEEGFIQKEFLDSQQEILNELTALKTKIQQRDQKIGEIHSRLQEKKEQMTSLIDITSILKDYYFAED